MKKVNLKFCFAFMLVLTACNYKHVDENNFIGTWQVHGRSMYDGMKIQIVKENGALKGHLISIPSNKYAKLFLDSGSIWIPSIQRASNFSFKITEQKIASELFSLYGLETSTVFYATFSEKKDRINLSLSNSDSQKESDIYYLRVP